MTSIIVHNGRLKLLSLALAVMLWFVVVWERPDEADFTARVVYTVPAGFVIKGPSPETLQVRVSGPKILLARLAARPVEAHCDLSGAVPGAVVFTNLERLVQLPRGLRVVRVQPATVDLYVVRKQ